MNSNLKLSIPSHSNKPASKCYKIHPRTLARAAGIDKVRYRIITAPDLASYRRI